MVNVQLIIDLVEPGVKRSRGELTATLPGVPAAGDTIDIARMLTLKVASVRWNALTSGVLVFLTATDTQKSGIGGVTDHEGELEVADYHVKDLLDAGWEIEES